MTNLEHKKIRFLTLILFVLFWDNIFSQDYHNWIPFNTGLLGGNVKAIALQAVNANDPDTVYVGTLGGGFYYSIVDGENWSTWKRHNTGLGCWNILSLMIKWKSDKTKIIYAGTTNGIYYLTDLKESWHHYEFLKEKYINLLVNCNDPLYPNAFYAGSGRYDEEENFSKGLWVLDGDSPKDQFLFNGFTPNIFDIIPFRKIGNNDNVYKVHVATDKGYFRFDGDLRSPSIHELITKKVFTLAARSGHPNDPTNTLIIYAGTDDSGKVSRFDGASWWPVDNFLDKEMQIRSLKPSFNESNPELEIYAATIPSKICRKLGKWDEAKWDTAACEFLPNLIANTIASKESNKGELFVGNNFGIYFSEDRGTSFSFVNSDSLFSNRVHTLVYDINKKNLWAGTDGALFKREVANTSQHWESEPNFFAHITSVVLNNNDNIILAGTKGDYIFRKSPITTGDWIQTQNGLTDSCISVIKVDNYNNIWVGTEREGIFKSINHGDNWISLNIISLKNKYITDIEIDEKLNILFVSTLKKGVFKINISDNSEAGPWDQLNVYSLAFNDSLFAGTKNGAFIWRDGSNFENWDCYEWEYQDVRRLKIVPTDSSFRGVLYALIRDSSGTLDKTSYISRKIIGYSNSIDTSIPLKFPDFQLGESFCVNLDSPNVVYLGTGGTGVYRYEFDEGQNPTFDPEDTLDFDEIPPNSSKSLSIAIINNFTFSPLIITIDTLNSYPFTLTTHDSFIIMPGKTGSCSITFKPPRSDDFVESLIINWRDIYLNPVNKGSKTIYLKGSGKGADLIINERADDVHYFSYQLCINHLKEEILDWYKSMPESLSEFDVIEPDCSWFNEGIKNWEQLLNDNDSGKLKFSFHPTEMGHVEDTIVINFLNDSIPKKKTLILSGTGLDAILEILNIKNKAIDTLDFFSVPVGDKKPDVKVILKNAGNLSLIIDKMYVLQERDVFKFDNDPNAPFTLGRDTVKEIVLYFEPESIKDYSGKLIIIHHDDCESSKEDTTAIILTGKGIEHKIDVFPPSALDFDTVHVKKDYVLKNLDIINCSDNDFVWLDTVIVVQQKVFKLVSDIPDNKKLAPEETLSVTIKFFVNDDLSPDSLLKEHIDSVQVNYFFGKDSLSALDSASIRIDTLTGTWISSRFNSSFTHWEKKIGISTSADTSIIFKNEGNIPLSYKMIDSCDKPFSSALNFDRIYEIKAGDSVLDSIKFAGHDVGTFEDTIKIRYWDLDTKQDTCIIDTLIISLSVEAHDDIPPEIRILSPDPLSSSQKYKDPIEITAKITDQHSGILEDSIKLHYRKGGETDFSRFSSTIKLDSITYEFEIPKDFVTLRGIEYFIEAYDKASNRSQFPNRSIFNYISPPIELPEDGVIGVDHNEKNIELHRGNAQKDYRLISIPIQIDGNKSSVVDILSNSLKFQKYDEYDWRCADYHYFDKENQSRFIYLDDPEFSDFGPGKSYFLIIKKGWQHNQIVCPHGYTTRTDTIYNQIVLNRGWNLIANPFNFPIPLKNLYLSESAHVDSIRKYLDKWDWETESMQPWTGYAIHTEQAETLFINPDLGQSFLEKNIKKEQEEQKYMWHIAIEASCQEARDDDNIAAVSSIGLLAYDCFDQPEPPPIGEYVMFAFPHPEWNKAGDYFAVDVQQPNPRGNFWDFLVSTNIQNSDVKLNFKNLESVPNNFQVMLICEHLNYIQDLTKNSQFLYNSTSADKSYKFRLVVGDPDFVHENKLDIDFLPKEFRLTRNFPNPFNGATTIRYELPQEDEITICIYNILGELIKPIKKNAKEAAGKYFIVWDGTNETGQPVSSGIYLCKFISSYQSKTFKMMLIR